MKGGSKRYEKYTKPLDEGGPLYGSNSEAKDDCLNLRLTTLLQNIQPAFTKVKAGDILSIECTSSNVLIAYNNSHVACGNIVSPFNKRIIVCIQKGNEFEATVIDLKGNIEVTCTK